MNKATKRQYLQYLLTLGLAVYLAAKWASGKLSYYINARFFPLTLFAIGALSLMAAAGLIQLNQVAEQEKKQNPKEQGMSRLLSVSITLFPILLTLLIQQTSIALAAFGLTALLGWLLLLRRYHHQPGQKTSGSLPLPSLLILSIPLIIGLIAPEQPLSTSSLNTRGVSLSAPLTISQQSADALEVKQDERTILDWIKLFNYESDPSAYIGEDVNVIGFVYYDARLPEGQFMVSRFIITCCVADAFAVGMPVDWPQDANLADNTWINVQGTLDEMKIGDQRVPMIHALSIQPIAAPEQPYLYP